MVSPAMSLPSFLPVMSFKEGIVEPEHIIGAMMRGIKRFTYSHSSKSMLTVVGNIGVDPSLFMDQLMLGGLKPGQSSTCDKKAVPFMGSMGLCDGWIEYGRKARDDFVRKNGCKPKEAQLPIEGSKGRAQTRYECAPDTPVVWTEFDGTHQPTREGQEDTWNFFSQFN
jgi:hypothetical protein